MKAAEAGPVWEEGVRLPSDGGRSIRELQQGQVRLFHPLQDGHVLPLRAQHAAPEQVELTARWKEIRGRKGRLKLKDGTH